jgi:hypothetical protein
LSHGKIVFSDFAKLYFEQFGFSLNWHEKTSYFNKARIYFTALKTLALFRVELTGIQQGFNRDSTGIQQGFNRDSTGIQQGFNRDSTGIQQRFNNDSTGIQQGFNRDSTRIEIGVQQGFEHYFNHGSTQILNGQHRFNRVPAPISTSTSTLM